MIPLHSICASLCAAVLFLSSPVLSADLAFSGTVFGTDGKPLSGVVVSLAQAKKTTTTDAAGAWSLSSTPAAIRTGQAVPTGSGRLVLEDGRLAVRFAGGDVAGRGQGVLSMVFGHRDLAARTTQSQDTLLYSLGNKVRLRDTVSASRTGIVRNLDTTLNASIIYGYLTDSRDGQTYRTVKIGTQTWMAQNLNRKVDSSWCSDDSVKNCDAYGRLYQWTAVMALSHAYDSTSWGGTGVSHQGICPDTWHVPSDSQWQVLEASVGMDAGMAAKTGYRGMVEGNELKAASGLWGSYEGTDDFGFAILPSGVRGSNGSFFFTGNGGHAYFWTATEDPTKSAWGRFFSSVLSNVYRDRYGKAVGFSLRCLQD